MQRFSIILVILALSLGCKKSKTSPEEQIPIKLETSPVKIVDTTQLKLVSTPEMLVAGKYVFTVTPSYKENFKSNDVLIDTSSHPFLRRIKSVIRESGKISLETSQGSLEDIIKNGNIKINFPLNIEGDFKGNKLASGSEQRRGVQATPSDKAFTISDLTLLDGPLSVAIGNISINFDPSFNLNFDYNEGVLKDMKIDMQSGANFIGNFDLTVGVKGKVAGTREFFLFKEPKKKTIIFMAGTIPIVVTAKYNPVLTLEAKNSFTFSRGISYSGNYRFNSILSYQNGVLTSGTENSGEFSTGTKNELLNLSSEFKVFIGAQITFEIYAVDAFKVQGGLNASLVNAVGTQNLDRNLDIAAWGGANIETMFPEIVGRQIPNAKFSMNTPSKTFRYPDTLIKLSGDMQSGQSGRALANPFKVVVKNTLGSPVENIRVYFEVKNGGGTLTDETVITDKDGIAITKLKPGNFLGEQIVEATVKRADGSLMNETPVTFTTRMKPFEGVTIVGKDMLLAPRTVYVRDGVLYIANYGNYEMIRWDEANKTGGLYAKGTPFDYVGTTYYSSPFSMTMDAQGNAYVNEYTWIYQISATTGQRKIIMEPAEPNVNGIQRMAIDNDGTRYLTHSSNIITKWEPGASSGVTIAGNRTAGSASNELAGPIGLFVKNDTVWVADTFNNRVQRFDPGSRIGKTVAGGIIPGSLPTQLSAPWDVFVNNAGDVYIADTGNSRVQKWKNGVPYGITVAGGNGNGSANNQIGMVTGIFVDKQDNIYVVDQNNGRVQKW